MPCDTTALQMDVRTPGPAGVAVVVVVAKPGFLLALIELGEASILR